MVLRIKEGARRALLSELRALSSASAAESDEAITKIAKVYSVAPEDIYRIAADNGIALKAVEQGGYHQQGVGSTGRKLPRLQAGPIGKSDLEARQAAIANAVEALGVKFTLKPVLEDPDSEVWKWTHAMDEHLWAAGDRPDLMSALAGPLAEHEDAFKQYRYPPAWIDRVVLSNGSELGWVEHETLVERYADDIRRGSLADVSIRHVSDAVGHGLFAEEAISRGGFIGEYAGVVHVPSPEEVALKTEHSIRRAKAKHEEGSYDLVYSPCADFSPLVWTNINADETGNHTRFINHSSEPNADLGYVFVDGSWHAIFVANRMIQPGEQITFDYGPNYWTGRGITPEELT